MARRKRGIPQLKTVLIVAEGYCDKAFAEHLKSLYVTRRCGVKAKITNAKGKGSNNVVRHAVNAREAYDVRVAFFDSDVPLRSGMRKKARSRKVTLVVSEPCLEGLLLKILERRVPEDSEGCKEAMNTVLGRNDPTERESYAIFDRTLLERKRAKIPPLDRLLRALEGA